MAGTDTIYHAKAKELGNMLLTSEAYQALAKAREVYMGDTDAQALDQKIADYNEALQTGIKMGTLTTDDYRGAVVELSDMERQLNETPSVANYIQAKEDYDDFIGSVTYILNKIVDNMGRSLDGGPKMCGCGANPGGACFSGCGTSAKASGGG